MSLLEDIAEHVSAAGAFFSCALGSGAISLLFTYPADCPDFGLKEPCKSYAGGVVWSEEQSAMLAFFLGLGLGALGAGLRSMALDQKSKRLAEEEAERLRRTSN